MPLFAHISSGTASELFWEGLLHPILGWDHLAAMLAVGILAGRIGGKAHAIVPAVFVALLLGGAVAGGLGVRSTVTELIVAASIAVFAMCLVGLDGVFRWPRPLLVVGVFAWAHGLAHGSELPSEGTVGWYVAGFMVTSTVLHLLGIPIGAWSAKRERTTTFTVAGLSAVSLLAVVTKL